jgi:hypothetical protein
MKCEFMRNAVVLGSVLVASIIPSQAFAQADVLEGLAWAGYYNDTTLESTYTFNQSMILNSIGFASKGNGSNIGLTTVSYTLNDTVFNLSPNNLLGMDANGFQWYDFANGGLSVDAASVLKVTTKGKFIPAGGGFFGAGNAHYETARYSVTSTNTSSNVTYGGVTASGGWSESMGTGYTNSNLRVSPANPGSNVAPEPGTFALALTGGSALLGICIRRRRNAA